MQQAHLYPADIIIWCLQCDVLLLGGACAGNLTPLPFAVTHMLQRLFFCDLQRLVCLQQFTSTWLWSKRVNLMTPRAAQAADNILFS